MDVLPTTCYESVKRYWRRRKYQRVPGSRHLIRRKLKIVRLGGSVSTAAAPTAPINKGGFTDMVFGLFRRQKPLLLSGGKTNTGHRVTVGSTGEEVDSRTVMEIYKKFAASRARETGCYI